MTPRSALPLLPSIRLFGLALGVIIAGLSILSVSAQNPLRVPPALTGPTYDMTMARSTTELTAGVQTNTAGYNDSILGPTLIMSQGDAVVLNVTNNLGETTTTHWHGMHVSPENDGGPHTSIVDGATWSPSFTVLDSAATMWYHPHLHGNTNAQVTEGLVGMLLVRDEVETQAGLPRTYGVDEFPLLLIDRILNNGQFDVGGLGNTMLVNGTLDPYLEVPAQLVRFRVVNASTERAYNFGVAGAATFTLVGTDGGLLEAPLVLSRMILMPGERIDVVIDLSNLNGSTLDLMAFNSEIPGNDIPGSPNGPGNSPLKGLDLTLVELRVQAPNALASQTRVPASFWTIPTVDESAATVNRTVRMTNAGPGAPFFLDSLEFDHEVINHTVTRDAVEVWSIVNETNFAHPFHIHDIQFRVLDIGGVAPPAELSGKKDTVMVPAFTTLRFIARFDDFDNEVVPYMYHCHILTHEDGGMMGQFRVIAPVDEPAVTPVVFMGAARFVNLSTRAQIGGAAGSPVAGFVLDGTGNKTLIVRAVGPGLLGFGITDALADPDLSLVSGTTTLAVNAGWEATQSDLLSSVGAFTLDRYTSDALLVRDLPSGVYTTPVGDGGDSGVVLLEFYDTQGTTTGIQLQNLSARAFVGTGDDTLNAGFVIAGEGTVKLLIRALGPTLTEYGLTGVLGDPRLSLLSSGATLASNTAWGDAANAADIATTIGAVGAFPLATTSDDAAILIELSAGIYSAVVDGADGGTGTALVEIYRVP
ncbi:MAG: multicopper oxidase domain-containing protein [Opitutaceae bacterium]|nr:multicopper oxidase domain-containing protein [Opitutaceae bacterium]